MLSASRSPEVARTTNASTVSTGSELPFASVTSRRTDTGTSTAVNADSDGSNSTGAPTVTATPSGHVAVDPYGYDTGIASRTDASLDGAVDASPAGVTAGSPPPHAATASRATTVAGNTIRLMSESV